MRRIAEFVLRHRRLVLVCWLLIVIAGIALTPQTNKRLVIDFSIPGQPGTQTANTIDAEFKSGGKTAPYLLSLTLPAGQTVTGHQQEAAQAFTSVTQAVPQTRVIDEANTGDRFFRTKDDQHRLRAALLPVPARSDGQVAHQCHQDRPDGGCATGSHDWRYRRGCSGHGKFLERGTRRAG